MWFLAGTTAADPTAKTDPGRWAQWAIPFLCRLPDELCVFAMHQVTRRAPQVARTPEFARCFATSPRYAALAAYCQ